MEGCERRARAGQLVCKDHADSALGRSVSREVVKLEREVRALMVAESQEDRLKAALRFRQRVERRDFAALFSGKFKALMEQAATENDFTAELGALRLAVVRLVLEEPDPTKMAIALSKVANASLRARQAQEELVDERMVVRKEVQRAWEAFNTQTQAKEDLIDARWKDFHEQERKLGVRVRGSAMPSTQPSPARESEFEDDEDVFEVGDGEPPMPSGTPLEMEND
jgi:hypothetical protein